MKKIFYSIMMAATVMLASCGGNAASKDTTVTDSVADTVVTDSTVVDSVVVDSVAE